MKRTYSTLLMFTILSSFSCGQSPRMYAQMYPDQTQSPEVRAQQLIRRMTLEEKASQLVNNSVAIPRLNIPAYNWWSESLHGVWTSDATVFPEPIGLGATFSSSSIHEMAEAIGIEGRIHHAKAVKEGRSTTFSGLDFWAPNLNIFRDPRWGRGQETYGEDPYLTGQLGVAFVTGLQGPDQNHYRAIATPKHFAVHSGPEPTRHSADVTVSKHDELDTYLPAFRAAIQEGNAASIMCAYNSINGEPACANRFLLQDQLRKKWGFRGYVVSDCQAVVNIRGGHHYTETQEQAVAVSLKRGMDNECEDPRDPKDAPTYVAAVRKGLLKESDIDQSLIRLFTARIKLGMFDPPENDPYSHYDEKLFDSPQHRSLARRIASESMVLLKNDGILPIAPSVHNIVVVGPLADQTKVLLGNYSGKPSHTVTILEGIKDQFSNAHVEFIQGTRYLSKKPWPSLPTDLLSFDGKPGAYAIYQKLGTADSIPSPSDSQSIWRQEEEIDSDYKELPKDLIASGPLHIEWKSTLTPKESGDYNFGFQGNGNVTLILNNQVVLREDHSTGPVTRYTSGHFEAGQSYEISLTYNGITGSKPHIRFIWEKSSLDTDIAKIKNADLILAVTGITSELEGEELNIHEDGFLGGDRTSISLPVPEQNLLQELTKTGKPIALLLTNGSAMDLSWAKEHVNAILEAWYPGEEGGSAVADILSGHFNPAGRLPITFYKNVDQLPAFENYSIQGRTYRYFTGVPVYPFGYGLSYTSFAYSQLSLHLSNDSPSGILSVSTKVRNTGKVKGDEVVQLYLQFPDVPGAPRIALRSFQRLNLEPGEFQIVHFSLKTRDMSMVTESGEIIRPKGRFLISVGGGQPGTGVPVLTKAIELKTRIALAE